MPIRNPFAKRTPGLEPSQDENSRPGSDNGAPTAFEKVDTMGSRTSALSVNTRNQEPVEYKMSVVNDSGVYLPPSPPEKKSFWPRRSNPSNTSSGTRSSLAENEPFSISRESFDSYRRSFDISARSPVTQAEPGRQSLDSARLPRLPRSASRRFEAQPPTAEEGFEEVGLNDDNAPKAPAPRKKGFLSRTFGESSESGSSTAGPASHFHIPGRKRGQSGQGSELGNMAPVPRITTTSEEGTEVR